MRYLIENEARIHYQKNGFVQIQDLLTSDEIQNVISSIKETLSKRERKATQKFLSINEKNYILGRDVYRDNAYLKKFTRSSLVTDVFLQITEKRNLRLAFDQVLSLQDDLLFNYKKFFSLEDTIVPVYSRFCIQGLESICIFCLEDIQGESQIIPTKSGDAVVIEAKKLIDFHDIFNKSPGIYYIIGLANQRAVYIHNPVDPCVHALKEIGYSYGDVLKEKWHPKII